ncbi:MAG: aminotransferase class V-fold PLP-dependent enzyme, partial [Polaromonas sp.]
IPGLKILAPENRERLGVISFYVENLHYNFIVRALSDFYGVQVRGGCSCAGTYGHYLLHVSKEQSKEITSKIDSGDLSSKPGWVRLSLHPVMTEQEVRYICDAIRKIVDNAELMLESYHYSVNTNEYYPVEASQDLKKKLERWFSLELD